MSSKSCIVMESEGRFRFKRAPNWWLRANPLFNHERTEVYRNRAPWETNSDERRQMARMLGVPEIGPEARAELKGLIAYWDAYQHPLDTLPEETAAQ